MTLTLTPDQIYDAIASYFIRTEFEADDEVIGKLRPIWSYATTTTHNSIEFDRKVWIEQVKRVIDIESYNQSDKHQLLYLFDHIPFQVYGKLGYYDYSDDKLSIKTN
jgi:hypothetical protein